jgi:phage gp36-like protein
MPYATDADVQFAAGGADRMLQLFDWNNAQTIDAATLARALEHADGIIDAYARRRFQVPILAPSATIRVFAANLAVHYTRKVRGLITESEAQEIERGHQLWLDRLASGLIIVSEPEPTPTTNIRTAIFPNESEFSMCFYRGLF